MQYINRNTYMIEPNRKNGQYHIMKPMMYSRMMLTYSFALFGSKAIPRQDNRLRGHVAHIP
jgi:hypothetical protein